MSLYTAGPGSGVAWYNQGRVDKSYKQTYPECYCLLPKEGWTVANDCC